MYLYAFKRSLMALRSANEHVCEHGRNETEASWYANKCSKLYQNEMEIPFYTWTLDRKKDQDEDTN